MFLTDSRTEGYYHARLQCGHNENRVSSTGIYSYTVIAK